MIVVISLGVSYFVGVAKTDQPNDQVSGFTTAGDAYYLTAGTGSGQGEGQVEATTTPVYMQTTATASSTVIGYTSRATALDLNIGIIASSSSSRLAWTLEFSTNYNRATGNGDWYFEDGSNVDSTISVTHGASPLINQWTPGTTVWQGKNITVQTLQSRWFRLRATVTGANAAVTIQAIPREEVPNNSN